MKPDAELLHAWQSKHDEDGVAAMHPQGPAAHKKSFCEGCQHRCTMTATKNTNVTLVQLSLPAQWMVEDEHTADVTSCYYSTLSTTVRRLRLECIG